MTSNVTLRRQPCLRAKPAHSKALEGYIYIKIFFFFLYIYVCMGCQGYPVALSPLSPLLPQFNCEQVSQC